VADDDHLILLIILEDFYENCSETVGGVQSEAVLIVLWVCCWAIDKII